MSITGNEWDLGCTREALQEAIEDEYGERAFEAYDVFLSNPNTGFTAQEVANRVFGGMIIEKGVITSDGERKVESNMEEVEGRKDDLKDVIQAFEDDELLEKRPIVTEDGVKDYYRFRPISGGASLTDIIKA